MKKIISEQFAINSLLVILSVMVIFHLFVVAGIIPFEIVWGGRLTSQQQMLVFETVSILINLLMLAATGIKGKFLKLYINPLLLKTIFWVMFGLFLLNTFGNLLAKNQFETFVFSPLTLMLSLFSLRIALSKN